MDAAKHNSRDNETNFNDVKVHETLKMLETTNETELKLRETENAKTASKKTVLRQIIIAFRISLCARYVLASNESYRKYLEFHL